MQIAEAETAKAREFKTRLAQVGDLEVELEMLRAKWVALSANGGGSGDEGRDGEDGCGKGVREAALEKQLKSAKITIREMAKKKNEKVKFVDTCAVNSLDADGSEFYLGGRLCDCDDGALCAAEKRAR